MIKAQKIKTFFIVLMAVQLLLAHINLAYADTGSNSVTNPPVYSGVSSQIELYLCAPTNAGNSAVNTTYFGTNTATNSTVQNNAASTDLFNCINKLYRFAIAAGSVVAILFIVIAGYLYMSADGAQETVDKAKNMFVSSITAMVILFAGYVLLRALNPDLLRFQSIQPPSVVVTPGTAAPATGAPSTGAPSTGTPPATGAPTTVNAGLCQAPDNLKCASAACNNFDSAINAAAQQFPISGVNTAALIKAIMVNESSCSPNPSASGANSWGLMQLQVATAQTYQSGCTTDTITQAWLTNANNSTKIICIGAHYLQDLSKSCSSVLNIAAGYNGGAKACAQSVDCTGPGCDGVTAMRAWECPFDDTNHNVANTGYTQSRGYAPKVLGCYQQFSPIR